MYRAAILVLAVVTLVTASCVQPRREDKIAKIVIHHEAPISPAINIPAYRVDFQTGVVEKQARYGEGDFEITRRLTAAEMTAFRNEASAAGFLDWKTEYPHDENLVGGSRWYIDVTFSDGATKSMTGMEVRPATWSQMETAFRKLFGENVLTYIDAD